MKKIFYIFFVFLLAVSCNSDDADQGASTKEENTAAEGKQIFRIDLKELSAKTANKQQKNLEPAFALVSVSDRNGNTVFTREKVVLTKNENSYVTAEIALAAATYTLTEFIITDENDVIISLAPNENSVLAEFASSPLPFDFVVAPNQTKEMATETINAAGYTSVDFGYTGLSLTFPENTDFFRMVVDDSDGTTTKVLKLKSITASTYLVDWGDGTIEEYVSTNSDSDIENSISHDYAQNGMYNIDISGPIKAIELLDFGSDQDDNYESHITAIDIAKLTLLKSCQLYLGKLKSLNTSENKALEFLGLGYNEVTDLDFTNNPNLKSVWLRYNKLTAIDISQNPNLEFLWIDGNQISVLDLSGNSRLKVLLARENNLSNIDFSNNLELERFDIATNSIAIIDITTNLALFEINVGANSLSSIGLSKNTNLVRVDLYANQLTNIDLTTNEKLTDLYIEDNLLTGIDLSANPFLERLIIGNNNLTTLDTSANPKIVQLTIENNQFSNTELDTILSQTYDQAIINSAPNGFINYTANPGTGGLANTTIVKLNELVLDYDWVVIGS